MIRIALPLVCAALGFAAASCSQAQRPLAPAAEAPASPGGTQGGASAAIMSPQHLAASPPRTAEDGAADASAAGAASGLPADTSSTPPAAPQVERRASTLIGMPAVAPDGTPLGEVKDIIFNRQGQATHLVIAYRSAPQAPTTSPSYGADRKLTAIPWDAAMASIKEGELVLGSATLHAAPSFTPDGWPDLDDPAWSEATDTYWRQAVRAAIAKHPGTPIDPTSRARERSRGGG
jgi:sporulation protein YlmC with PRC-barrel domain